MTLTPEEIAAVSAVREIVRAARVLCEDSTDECRADGEILVDGDSFAALNHALDAAEELIPDSEESGLAEQLVSGVVASLPAEAVSDRWSFDRYVNGQRMAEGIGIHHAETVAEAAAKAAGMCKGERGTVLVLAKRKGPLPPPSEDQ